VILYLSIINGLHCGQNYRCGDVRIVLMILHECWEKGEARYLPFTYQFLLGGEESQLEKKEKEIQYTLANPD
jgi:hypothetical protein